jgi:hypothetical protein
MRRRQTDGSADALSLQGLSLTDAAPSWLGSSAPPPPPPAVPPPPPAMRMYANGLPPPPSALPVAPASLRAPARTTVAADELSVGSSARLLARRPRALADAAALAPATEARRAAELAEAIARARAASVPSPLALHADRIVSASGAASREGSGTYGDGRLNAERSDEARASGSSHRPAVASNGIRDGADMLELLAFANNLDLPSRWALPVGAMSGQHLPRVTICNGAGSVVASVRVTAV